MVGCWVTVDELWFVVWLGWFGWGGLAGGGFGMQEIELRGEIEIAPRILPLPRSCLAGTRADVPLLEGLGTRKGLGTGTGTGTGTGNA